MVRFGYTLMTEQAGPCQLVEDAMVAVEPDADLVARWRQAAPDTERFVGQIPVCFDRDESAAVARARLSS